MTVDRAPSSTREPSPERGAGPDAEPATAGSVQSLVRGLTVIRVFDADHDQLTLSDVARRADLNRATVRRILHTLVTEGYMGTDGRRFSLRPRVLELGYAYLSALGLPQIAVPHLEQLTRTVDESSSLAILDGTDIVYVARSSARRIMGITISVGTRFPAYATSMGRALLAGQGASEVDAYLAGEAPLERLTAYTVTDPDALRAELGRVREQGWAFVDQELEDGLRSIAAPVRDRRGSVVAAVNISASTRRGSADELLAELVRPLLRTAAAIGADLHAHPHHP